jgi:hypothetical protein
MAKEQTVYPDSHTTPEDKALEDEIEKLFGSSPS